MKELLYLIIIYGGIALISWSFSFISNVLKRHREKIRDKVAEEVLSGLNIEAVIESYESKLAHIKYIKTDETSNIVQAKSEYNKTINEQIIDDIRRIYLRS